MNELICEHGDLVNNTCKKQYFSLFINGVVVI